MLGCSRVLLNPIGIAAVVAAGFGLGRLHLQVRLRAVAMTALMAAVLHASLKFALPHDSIEGFAQRHVYGGSGALVLILIAAVETAGLWVPVAVTPWAAFSARAWVTSYMLAAAVLGAAGHYFPFDVRIINGEIMGPKHPSYELDLVLSLPLGFIGYLLGWLRRRRRATMRTA
jgi:hypothetical protein